MSIGTIVAGAALQRAGESISGSMSNAPDSNLRAAAKHASKAMAAGHGRTLITSANDLKVEPFVLVDERAARLPYITDVMYAAQRLFTSYYLISVAADNVIGTVSVSRRLGKFNPNRDLLSASAEFLSFESYQFGLPFNNSGGLDNYEKVCRPEYMPHFDAELSNESKTRNRDLKSKNQYLDHNNSDNQLSASTGKTMQTATEINNLSVGQIVDVEIVQGDKSAKIPVLIRLNAIGVSPAGMVDILGLGMENNSRSMRWTRFKAGALSFKELITNQDIVDNYRKAMFRDKSGYFRKANARFNKGLAATVLTNTPSIGSLSSIAIITNDTRRDTEAKHFGNFDDFERRQRVFEKSLLMMIMVVNDDMNTITIYSRDIAESQTYTLDELKKSSNKKNDNLEDMLKAFLGGNIPGRL